MYLKDENGNPVTAYKHICQYCGKIFYTRTTGDKWCSPRCHSDYNHKNRTWAQKRAWEASVKESTKSLNDIVKAATEAGMSYGEYVAKRLGK